MKVATDWTIETSAVYDEKVKTFQNLVNAHDLTYSFSDDHRVWSRGEFSWKKINEAAREILPDDAADIWNKMVDETLTNGSREMFYSTAEHWKNRR